MVRFTPMLCVLLPLVACVEGEGQPRPMGEGGAPARGALARAQVADNDMDGVSNEDESTLGTDPNDPSDAPMWHPELTTYPRTLIGPSEKSLLQSRLSMSGEPYTVLASRIRGTCNASPAPYDDPDGLDQGAIYANASIAKACAALSWAESDSAKASKAISILKALPQDLGEPSLELWDNTAIHVAEALTMAAQAYDFLRATAYLSSSDRTAVEDVVLSLTESCWRVYVELLPIYFRFHEDNHKSKLATGLGLVGMVMNDQPEAARYVNFAMTEMKWIMDIQTTNDGGYGEGPYYLNYSTDNLLPFMVAYHRFAQGRDFLYRMNCDVHLRNSGCPEGENLIMADPATDPAAMAPWSWWLSIMMPDGNHPDIDDSNRGATFNGVLQGLTGQGAYLMAWERNTSRPWYSVDCVDMSLDSLLLFRPEIAASEPSFKSIALYEAGQGVLRSGWEKDARYLLLQAEHGDAREEGAGHEHPDGTAVLVHAYEEYLLIDSGYGSWSVHEEVNKAENHSLVLIDGGGPDGSYNERKTGADTYLEKCSFTNGFERCDARTSFNGVTQVRSVWMIDGGWFVVADRLTPNQSGSTHDYDLLWHTGAGGDSGGAFTLGSLGASVVRSKAGLTLAVTSTRGAPTLTPYDDKSAGPTYGTLGTHTVLQASISGGSLAMLTVIEPRRTGSALPTWRLAGSSNGTAALIAVSGTTTTLTLINEPGVTARLSTTTTGLPEVVTNASFAAITFQSGVYQKHKQEGASTLTVGGVSVL